MEDALVQSLPIEKKTNKDPRMICMEYQESGFPLDFSSMVLQNRFD
jgi:hypothetical protein